MLIYGRDSKIIRENRRNRPCERLRPPLRSPPSCTVALRCPRREDGAGNGAATLHRPSPHGEYRPVPTDAREPPLRRVGERIASELPVAVRARSGTVPRVHGPVREDARHGGRAAPPRRRRPRPPRPDDDPVRSSNTRRTEGSRLGTGVPKVLRNEARGEVGDVAEKPPGVVGLMQDMERSAVPSACCGKRPPEGGTGQRKN